MKRIIVNVSVCLGIVIFGNSCAQLVGEIVAQLVVGIIVTAIQDENDIHPKPGMHPEPSLTEQFYLRAARTDHYLAGVRIINDFDSMSSPFPQVSRMEIDGQFWHQMLFSESEESAALRNFFYELDGQPVTIALIQPDLLTDDLGKNFNYRDFLRFNEELRPILYKVVIFDNNLLAFHSEINYSLHLLLLPHYSYSGLCHLFHNSSHIRGK